MAQRLFKAMERRYAAGLMNRGEIQIGTLHDFHTVEAHSEENDQADPTEGAFFWDQHIDEQTHASDFPKGSPASKVFSGNVLVSGTLIRERVLYPDSYIYSTSKEADPETARRLDPKYNCFVEITDPDKFFEKLSVYLRDKKITDYGELKDCLYTEKSTKYPNIPKFDIAFTKEKKFEYQKEVRCIWTSFMGQDPVKQIIKCRSIRRHVKIHSQFKSRSETTTPLSVNPDH